MVTVVLGVSGQSSASGQVVLSPRFGFHVDHPPRSEMAIVYKYTPNLYTGDIWEISQPATITTYGGRLEFAFHPRFRLQLEAQVSHNEHSSKLVLNPELPPGTVEVDSAFRIRYRFLSVRAALDLFPNSFADLTLAFGPTWIRRSGTGRLMIEDHPSGLGAALQGSVRLARHLSLGIDASVVSLPSDPVPYFGQVPPGSSSQSRHDIHLLAGLTWTLGHPLAGGGVSHGPSLAPRTPSESPR